MLNTENTETLMAGTKKVLELGSRGRPVTTFLEGEGRNSEARAILRCSERRIVGLIEEDKISARRNTDLGRDGQWMIYLPSVEEYKAIVEREHEAPRLGGDNEELSAYLRTRFADKLLYARIHQIDGRETGLDQAWVRYSGKSGRKCLARFKRGDALLGRKFVIEIGGEGVKVHYRIKEGENKRAIKAGLLVIARRAIAAAKKDAARLRVRQEREW